MTVFWSTNSLMCLRAKIPDDMLEVDTDCRGFIYQTGTGGALTITTRSTSCKDKYDKWII